MAILKGPLFSLAASGKLANTLVFADWKGIKYARQHVSPANPNTSGQQTQRGYLSDAVAQWHDLVDVLNAVDKANLNRYAGILGTAMSGFNAFVRNYVNTRVAGVTIVELFDTTEGTPSGGGMQIVASSGISTGAVLMYYGTSKTALVNYVTRTESPTPGTTHTFDMTGLTPGTVYFYKIVCNTANSEENLGIGKFTAA